MPMVPMATCLLVLSVVAGITITSSAPLNLVAGHRGRGARAPTVVFNVSSLHTMDPANPAAEAFCIGADGRFAAVGTLEQAIVACPTAAARLDLQGGHVIPGLIDSHFHLLYGGFKLLLPDLDNCTSASDPPCSITPLCASLQLGQ